MPEQAPPPQAMATPANRFDDSFNEVDPITHRPFSAGHPDGVWMVAIFFGLISTMAAVPAVLTAITVLTSNAEVEFNAFAPLGGCMLLLGPPVLLLFLRNQAACWWLAVLALLAVAMVATLYFGPVRHGEAPMETFWQAAGLGGLMTFIACYSFGLRRDRLLK